jgi:hypothetical protein
MQQALEWRHTYYLDQPALAGSKASGDPGVHFA